MILGFWITLLDFRNSSYGPLKITGSDRNLGSAFQAWLWSNAWRPKRTRIFANQTFLKSWRRPLKTSWRPLSRSEIPTPSKPQLKLQGSNLVKSWKPAQYIPYPFFYLQCFPYSRNILINTLKHKICDKTKYKGIKNIKYYALINSHSVYDSV